MAASPVKRGVLRSLRPERRRPTVEAEDIQGLALRGYGDLPRASYHLLGVRDAVRCRSWLAWLSERVARGEPASRGEAVQVAFTHPGLRALELPDRALSGFSAEFIAGMADPIRSRFLGDQDNSDPSGWQWGGPTGTTVHVLLMLYARGQDELERLQDEHDRMWSAGGCVELKRLIAGELTGREHFGFADGVSQPAIEGYHDSDSPLHRVKPGEFLLGYENEYAQYTPRPLLDPDDDPRKLLALDIEGSGACDFGRNGSYLVFRQLHQNVSLFHAVLEELSRRPDGSPDPLRKEWLGAKMVGRWPSGTSLSASPLQDMPELASDNEFGYHAEDAAGLRCPIGSHVRRSNPRDALGPAPGTSRALALSKRHRLLRRGRPYGPPLVNGRPDAQDRGLLFIALNANLQRQFEFIQHSWINNPSFAGLYNDSDPIAGPRSENDFTIQRDPVRQKCNALPRFVEVAGGAYFFMPGIRALRYLGQR